MVQAAAAEVEGEKGELEKVKSEVKVEIANLRAAKAEFDAHIAEQTAGLVEKGAGLTEKSAQITQRAAEVKEMAMGVAGKVAESDTFAANFAENLDNALAEFMMQVDAAMGAMQQKSIEIDRKASKRPIGGTTRREGGKLFADVQFDDGSTRSITAERGPGGLRIVGENPDSEGIGG